MISRVAESCYWLMRYMERAESTARLVAVNRVVILDAGIHNIQRWKPIMMAIGEHENFEKRHSKSAYDKRDEAESYLTWSKHNPNSIYCSLAGARENARITREIVSREMWEGLNVYWQWLNGDAAKKEYRRDRARFYRRALSTCAEFQGNCQTTMLHDEPFDFMRLGTYLERASQTARVLNIKQHWNTGRRKTAEQTPEEAAQWIGVLRLSAAVEPFFKRHRAAPTGPLVAKFLIQDRTFPHSVVYCLSHVCSFLDRIRKDTRRNPASLQLAKDKLKELRCIDTDKLDASHLPELLDDVVQATGELNNQLYTDFFDPTLALKEGTTRRKRRR